MCNSACAWCALEAATPKIVASDWSAHRWAVPCCDEQLQRLSLICDVAKLQCFAAQDVLCCLQGPAQQWARADEAVTKSKMQHLRKAFPRARPELLLSLLKANQGNVNTVKQVQEINVPQPMSAAPLVLVTCSQAGLSVPDS